MTTEINIMIAILLHLLVNENYTNPANEHLQTGTINNIPTKFHRCTVNFADFMEYKSCIAEYSHEILSTISGIKKDGIDITIADEDLFKKSFKKMLLGFGYSISDLQKDFRLKLNKTEPLKMYPINSFEFILLIALACIEDSSVVCNFKISIRDPLEIQEQNIDDVNKWFICDALVDVNKILNMTFDKEENTINSTLEIKTKRHTKNNPSQEERIMYRFDEALSTKMKRKSKNNDIISFEEIKGIIDDERVSSKPLPDKGYQDYVSKHHRRDEGTYTFGKKYGENYMIILREQRKK